MTKMMVSHPWDMAGADGLTAARALFGEAVDRLAPFQSMETSLDGVPCSVLRLCDRNFRITYPGPLDARVASLGLQLWVKRLDWMGAIDLPIDTMPALVAQAIVRAPHRLHPLPLHRAVPAQLGALPVVVWHHPIGGQPALELHLAQTQIKNLWDFVQPLKGSSVSLTTAHTQIALHTLDITS